MTEKRAICVQGLLPLILLVLAVVAAVLTGKLQWILDFAPFLLVLIVPIVLFWLKGLFIVSPNEAKVLTFFGKYTGTVRNAGFWFANPL